MPNAEDPPDVLGATAPQVQEPTLRGRTRTFKDGLCIAERYRIVRLLGEGAMGQVYEADDAMLGQRIALKTIHARASSETMAALLRREIQFARRVTHPNVCRAFDVGIHGDTPFVTMELVVGETLAAQLQREGPLDGRKALAIVVQLAAALDAAHEASVVHRDFKSSNIMLEERPANGPVRAVVMDFGLACARTPQSPEDANSEGEIVGTPAYMSPEQVEGKRDIDAAADIYALGVVMFEMVTGCLPFVAETPLATMMKRLWVDPPRPTSLAPGLDPCWDDAILRCLSRDPANRFAHAGDVAAALKFAERYKIVRRIGEGPLGETYAADDLLLGERVALKYIRRDAVHDEVVMARFRTEIRVLRRVTHPNVCRIFDVGVHGDRPFVTMELVAGESLASRLQRGGALLESEARPIVAQLAAALDAVHDHGFVYRELTTASIKLADLGSGKPRRAVLMRLGFPLMRWRLLATENSDSTTTHEAFDRMPYMAPEELLSPREVGPSADIYALGVVMFEMVTGRQPFLGETRLATLATRMRDDPPRPSTFAPGLDPCWEDAILRCLAREPAERFTRAGDVAAAITVPETSSRASPPSIEPRHRATGRRELLTAAAKGGGRRWALSALAVVILGAAVVVFRCT